MHINICIVCICICICIYIYVYVYISVSFSLLPALLFLSFFFRVLFHLVCSWYFCFQCVRQNIFMLRCMTYLARGLRQNKKRRKYFAFLLTHTKYFTFSRRRSIVTHCDESRWENEWGGQIFFDHGTYLFKSRCLQSLNLTNTNLTVRITRTFRLNNGRLLISGCHSSLKAFYA